MNVAIILVSGIFFAMVTFYANNRLNMGGVMASALISILVSLLLKIFPEILNPRLNELLPLVAMGASFVGMASSRYIRKNWVIAIAGLLFSCIFLVGNSFFEGYGGSLGTSAAISLAAAYGFKILKNRII